MSSITDSLTDQEIVRLRRLLGVMSSINEKDVAGLQRLLDVSAIQDVMLRYGRLADRKDGKMGPVFWEDGSDNHGTFSGTMKQLSEGSFASRLSMTARYHILGSPQCGVRTVDGSEG